MNGLTVSGSSSRKISAGPTVNYQVGKRLLSTLRWTRDMGAFNDFEGDEVWLRFTYSFQ